MVTIPEPTAVTRPLPDSTVATNGASVPQTPPVSARVDPSLMVAVAVNVSVAPTCRRSDDEETVIDWAVALGADGESLPPHATRVAADTKRTRRTWLRILEASIHASIGRGV
jgi:hypothetical protein